MQYPEAPNQIDLTNDLNKHEQLAHNLLDLFDQKYSCSYLSIHEQHDLFYLNERQILNSRKKYYDLNKEEQTGLMSIPFSDVNTRQVLIQAFKDKKTAMETAVPGLKEYISSGTSNKDALDFIENAHSFANEYSGQVNPDIKNKINMVYGLYTQFIQYVNDIKSANYPNSKDLEQSAKIGLENEIKSIIDSDPTKVIEQYYNYGVKKIVNENVRDAPASINRNY